MVLVAETLKGVPVNSRVSAFRKVFGMAEGGLKGEDGGRKAWI